MSLAITFWGVRGSIPTPGPSTARYGGNTACLLVESPNGRLILDAGTGLRPLGRSLAAGVPPGLLEVDLLVSHTHWDHIQGFPFFAPLFRPGDQVRVHGPAQTSGPLGAILRNQMAPDVFPVPLSGVRADLVVHDITEPELELPAFRVGVVPARHPAPTLGYSVAPRGGGERCIYLTDNELHHVASGAERAELIRFLYRADTLVHDAMYFETEARGRRGWGHSTAIEAVTLAAEAECRSLVLFHHDPDHDDSSLDRLLGEALEARDRLGTTLEVTLATEGTTLRVEAR